MKHLALIAILLVPLTADAGPQCGGGGGGNDGNGGGDHRSSGGGVVVESSSSFDMSTTEVPVQREHGCSDDTDVVGYRRCTKFGVWANNLRLPRMFFELGTQVRQFGNMLGTESGTVSHGAERFTYRMVTPEAGTDTAITSVLRWGFSSRRGLYAGTEIELGGITAHGTPEMTTGGTFGTPSIDPSTGMYFGALGVVGMRATTRRGNVALEGGGGIRATMYRFESEYHNCEETSSIEATGTVVEARARAELFLGPWFTAGATLGTSLIDRDDWLAGIYFGIHNRAFAGGR